MGEHRSQPFQVVVYVPDTGEPPNLGRQLDQPDLGRVLK
jgi:hypothetical protein